MKPAKKMSAKADMALDRKMGIKEDSKKDKALDKARGVSQKAEAKLMKAKSKR